VIANLARRLNWERTFCTDLRGPVEVRSAAMSITNLAMRRGILRDHVAQRLGISQRELNLLDVGRAFFDSETSIQNARERLGVTRTHIQLAIDECSARTADTPVPFELRELEARANELWQAHRDDPVPYLASQGEMLQPGHIPEQVLKLSLVENVLGGFERHRFSMPSVNGTDRFAVVGYWVAIAPVAASEDGARSP